ncbi:putative glutathione S-transferase 7 [Orchesella cincta]|uniref:glutathione transferase n=1 Tax=Orchesella cincta TaxID=48709 RepID=A0A1D2MJ77_ORCCI|nr:putative glutathione S-transferase 7 [Orchesella cincta]
MTVPKYRLTYFNWMWIAEPTRFLLSYVGEDFEDVRLSYEEWMKDDPKINKNDFPYGKLPVLEDRENNLKLGQSFAIARYLARKYNLVGNTIVDAAKCDEYADVLKDMLSEVEPMWRADEKQKAEIKAAFLEKTVPRYFSVIETDLKNNGGKYLVGKTTTWVDFLCAHFTEMFQIYLNTDILTNYPALKAHQHQVFEISAIKEWKDKRPVTPY